MPLYGTEIHAICPQTGELKRYGGPNVSALTPRMAEQYCQENGLGYCKVHGELVAEIPCKTGSYEPDFARMIDYQNPGLN